MIETANREWFLSQSGVLRVAYLLRIMHSMTVDFRNATSTEQIDSSLRVAKKFNEIMHYLTSYGAAELEQRQHLPDEDLIDGLYAMIADPSVASFLALTTADVSRFAAPAREGDQQVS